MKWQFSTGLPTGRAAMKLGVTPLTLQRHVAAGNLDAPPLQKVGGITVRLWTDRDIENARAFLAGIKHGRRKKQRSEQVGIRVHNLN